MQLVVGFPVVEFVDLGIARIQGVGCHADCLETTSLRPITVGTTSTQATTLLRYRRLVRIM
jgi:hypothetical protein